MSESTPQNWYREPWAWFLLAILVWAVAGGLSLAYIATRDADTLVQDNYYKDGLAINQNLSRDRRALELGLQATLTIDPEIGELRIHLSGLEQNPPEQLRLKLLSPTRAKDDIALTLKHTPSGDYLGQLTTALQGRRYAQLETPDQIGALTELNGRENLPGWRLSSPLLFDQRTQYTLTPADSPQ